MQARQQGFTLIELTLVIVMLGILSAFALPRFANLGKDARIASVQGAAASIRSASAIFHAAFLAQGSSSSYVKVEGVAIGLVAGYPKVNSGATLDITAAAGIAADSYQIVRPSGSSTYVDVLPLGVASNASCYVRYNQASISSGVITPPTITIQTGGC